jgi:hypothetical protein
MDGGVGGTVHGACRRLSDFGALSAAEQKVLSELDGGEPVVVGNGELPSEAEAPETAIRAAFLRYLLLDGAECRERGVRLHERGLRIVGASVEGALDLQCCAVAYDLELRNCRIAAAPKLEHARLQGLRLNGSAFPGLHGEWLEAREISLDGATVHGEVRLIGAKIRGKLDCDDCRIVNPGKMALSLTRAEIGAAFFLRGRASIDGMLRMTGARLRTIVDDAGCWPKRGDLDLSGCTYEGFAMGAAVSAQHRLPWLRLQRAACLKEFSPQPFEQCALVLQRAGHGDEARAILIEKERLSRAAERRRTRAPLRQIKWLRDALLAVTIRYGYAPMLAAAWLLGFWALGTVVAGAAYHDHAFKPATALLRRAEWMACGVPQGETRHAASLHEALAGQALPGESQLECFLRQPESESYPRFNAAVYSLDTLLPVVSFGVDDYWSPDGSKRSGAFALGYVFCHVLVGWALTFLAVAGFSGLVKAK